MTSRLLAATSPDGWADLATHRAVHGPLPALGSADAEAVIGRVGDAGLRGRGGAGFPTARKLAAVAGAGSRRRRPVVIVNGTEGEPASRKDRLLLTSQPHLVLDGATAAALAVGASEIHVAAPRQAHAALGRALAERPVLRGEPRVTLHESAPGYVAGEETAVIAHLEGRPARPRLAPPRPAEQGLFGRPTLVQNAETLAHLALIVRHGADWFRGQGTDERPGTTLVTLSGAVGRRGVHEVPVGATVGELLHLAGGSSEPLRALMVGGYFGAWIPAAGDTALTDGALRPLGAAVGAGIVIALGVTECPVARTAELAAWMAGQSAGQCGPCVNGLDAIAGALSSLAQGHGTSGDLARLERWTAMVQGRGACAHPTGTGRMIQSALSRFPEDFADHARHGRCATCAGSARRASPGSRVIA